MPNKLRDRTPIQKNKAYKIIMIDFRHWGPKGDIKPDNLPYFPCNGSLFKNHRRKGSLPNDFKEDIKTFSIIAQKFHTIDFKACQKCPTNYEIGLKSIEQTCE